MNPTTDRSSCGDWKFEVSILDYRFVTAKDGRKIKPATPGEIIKFMKLS